MFEIKIDSWEKHVSEFADMLDSSNMEAWPYVDLTDQRVGVQVALNWGDPTCEEPLQDHELVDIAPKSSHEGYEFMERFAETRPETQTDKLYQALHRRHPFSTFRHAVEDIGILQAWYDFKSKALEELAEERLRDHAIEFKDDKIVCTNRSRTSIFNVRRCTSRMFALLFDDRGRACARVRGDNGSVRLRCDILSGEEKKSNPFFKEWLKVLNDLAGVVDSQL